MTKQFSSVWTREPHPPRQAGLSREQIVKAAQEILDAEGLEALSMRKLGAKLNAGATSLYWHVANKDELLELVYDEAWGAVRLPDPDETSWREVMTTFAYSLQDAMMRHPWMTSLIGRMAALGPNALRLTDRLRKAFKKAGFTGIDVDFGCAAIMSYVLGYTIPQVAWIKAAGGDYDLDSIVAAIERAGADYPELVAEYRDLHSHDPAAHRAMAFDFGLLCVLDGLESRLRKGAGS
ncbi:TetR/AcrR family transcriptional regulator [Thermoactinospora rubra]|uniref:TetR/AcrR family transcriptional regulator n=1 Tax=Thermoactinospora rubra TaxID=1088767 RepID=UPI000A100D98|nr:TetR/AcrR family transcriptional regulator [Thermoactinospora rubra]